MAIDRRNVRIRCLNCGRLGTFLNGPNCLFCGAPLPMPGAVPPPPRPGTTNAVAPPVARAPVVAAPLPVAEIPPTDMDAASAAPGAAASVGTATAENAEVAQAHASPVAPPPAPYQPAPQYRSPVMPPGQYYQPVPWIAAQTPPARKSPLGAIFKGIGAVLLFLLLVGAVRLGAYAVASGAFRQLSLAGASGSSTSVAPWSNVVFSDSLKTNNGMWANENGCQFKSDGYHVSQGYDCYAPAGDFQDAQVTVTAAQDVGRTDAYYGLVFRRVSSGNLYFLDVTSDGAWAVERVVNDKSTFIVPAVKTTALHQGLGKANTLRVRMSGSHFVFFVNGTQIGQVSDTTYASGRVGVSGAITGTDTIFSDFSIALP